MHISIAVDLDYRLSAPGAAILTVEAAQIEGQQVLSSETVLTPAAPIMRVAGDEGVGQRIVLRGGDRIACRYRAEIEVTRGLPALSRLHALPVEDLPGEALRQLLPSRYCESHRLEHFVRSRFGGQAGGALVASLRDWIEAQLDYVPGSSSGDTTAADTFLDRRGVCRDYAHLMIALCRAALVPARIASVYAPSVEPPDFHAVAQVYLEGGWHLVDPTGMAEADAMAVIAVGRDATDVAFLTTIPEAELQEQRVAVRQSR